MKALAIMQLLCLVWAQAAGASAPLQAQATDQRIPPLMHFPTVSRTHVAFVYANDIWYAPRKGGVAAPLTDAPGMKYSPRFSPDGRSVAFVANLEGAGQELYTIALEGGPPRRVTHTGRGKELTQWTADDRLLFYTNTFSFVPLATQLFTTAPAGGLPARLPVAYGAEGAISPDGEWLAYTQNWPNSLMNTWKRYRGGMAQDIWLLNLRTRASQRATTWEGTDSKPMWHGGMLYYLSDAGPEHRHNIWTYDPKTSEHRQVTRFDEYDVKNPSVGPGAQGRGEIVFQYAAGLYLLDLATGKTGKIEVTIPEQRRPPSTAAVDASRFITAFGASPAGERVAVEARGDIWVLDPAKGSPRNITHTSGVFERDPAWSPDGEWVAYFSDEPGEYELYVARADGSGEKRRLTGRGPGFRYRPTWSPDSKVIAFLDEANAIYVHAVGPNETRRVDADLWGERPQLSWSPDSAWLAYAKTESSLQSSIWVYDTGAGATRRVTEGMFADFYPAFDRGGDYLFFASTRNFSSPVLNTLGGGFVHDKPDTLVAIPLRKGVGPPAAGAPAQARAVAIDFDEIERRAVQLPAHGADIRNLSVAQDGRLLYLNIEPGGARSLNAFDLAEKKTRVILDGLSSFSLSADGKKIVALKGRELLSIDLAADAQAPAAIPTTGMRVDVDLRAEWRQMFNDVWRLYRDFFYDPNMHGVNWPGIRERYSRLLDSCATREDVNFVMADMVGELNVGHAYMSNLGDVEQAPAAAGPVGMLGADFVLENGAYRIAKIYEGGRWDAASRGPLSQPGAVVKAGDYLLAVNDRPVDASKDPWAAFQGLANRDTTLTLGDKPVIDGSARRVTVKPLAQESSLRNLAWIEANRNYVERRSGGKIGYLHLPDVSTNGLNALVKQFYGQVGKDALIIDIRWSAGGSLGHIFARLLDPTVFNYFGGRHSGDRVVPQRTHAGPKCVITSGMTVSAGENFSYYFRKSGAGKLVGSRTWGGLIGLNGNPSLIDGGYFNIPNAPFFEDDGTWMIEGHGIEPDLEVTSDPAVMFKGTDSQLDAAINHLMDELKRYKPKPRRPPYPDRSRMGVKEADK
jgi:tricorn protease